MKLLSLQKGEKGTVIIIVAAAMAAFMAVSALAIDVGLLYQERRQLQTAVDAAALAAAQELAEEGTFESAETLARGYVIENSQVIPDSITVSYPAPNQVKVTASTTRKLFLARVLGKTESSLQATATATYGAATSVRNLVPIIVPQQFVDELTKEGLTGTLELGSDRPLEAFRKEGRQEGSTITYTITFTNKEPKTIGINLTDPIPNNTAYIEGSASDGGTYDSETNSVKWRIESIPQGGTISVSLAVKILSGSAAEIKNTAEAISDSGKKYTASTSGKAQEGYFWLCDFNAGSGGTPDYVRWIEEGYEDEVDIGDGIAVSSGEGVRAALKGALANRLENKPEVLLPIYDYTEGGGSPGIYHVISFAKFKILDFDFLGSPKTITLALDPNGTVAAGSGTGTPPASYFGVDAVWLID